MQAWRLTLQRAESGPNKPATGSVVSAARQARRASRSAAVTVDCRSRITGSSVFAPAVACRFHPPGGPYDAVQLLAFAHAALERGAAPRAARGAQGVLRHLVRRPLHAQRGRRLDAVERVVDDHRGARRGGAPPARRTSGERQHLPASRGAGEDGRDGRPGQRRSRRARPRRGVAGERASCLRHRVLDRGRAPGAARRGLPGDQGAVHAAAHHLPGQVLPAHRRAARAQAGAASRCRSWSAAAARR